jgi:hypothetical protein
MVNNPQGEKTMYDSNFFQTKLGQASIASVAAMVMFVAVSTQMQIEPAMYAVSDTETVEIA